MWSRADFQPQIGRGGQTKSSLLQPSTFHNILQSLNNSIVPQPPAGHFNVLFFASASSFTGKEHEALPATMSLSKLFTELENRYPGIRAKILDSCLVTVNLDYVDVPSEEGAEDTVIREADEVAIIPPVSSG
ncbi:molybdopterin synthase sulfur carrier subunit [Fusarium longipes]|uniref:Molybdopterin synthase sulfur carrier subunit n=1 Tax=Fusarium longipes TaxID=694270 RepID=A0A395SS64_9HYPO|nr:molybdopterin synthase sulfur carrier subunit [Fusarium longipes]